MYKWILIDSTCDTHIIQIVNDGAEVTSVDIDSIFRPIRSTLHQTTESVEPTAKQSAVIITGVSVKWTVMIGSSKDGESSNDGEFKF